MMTVQLSSITTSSPGVSLAANLFLSTDYCRQSKFLFKMMSLNGGGGSSSSFPAGFLLPNDQSMPINAGLREKCHNLPLASSSTMTTPFVMKEGESMIYDPQYLNKHTTNPVVTGTSVLAIKYKDGVMMAADCLASYGSLARFRDIQRLNQLGKHTLIGTSGDIADMQVTLRMLAQYHREELVRNDGHEMGARQWHMAISSVQYAKRSEMKPLWNAHIIAGVCPYSKAEPPKSKPSRTEFEIFLGYSDLLGTTYEEDEIATGFGAYLARPIMRAALEERGGWENLQESEAIAILEQCLRVLYYRDARSLDKVQMAKVTMSDGVIIGKPYQLSSDWSIA